MTPDTQQAPSGYRRRQRQSQAGDATAPVRSGYPAPDAARTRHWPSIDLAPGSPAPPAPAVPVAPADAPAAEPAANQAEAPAQPGQPGQQAAAATSHAAGARTRSDGSIVGVVPYLAVLVCTGAGLYIAWHKGSAGGGEGGVVAGLGLLAAALVRLVLPTKLAGLLATRKRMTDVLTLAAFGAGLVVAGLVLPRLRADFHTRENGRPADERE